MKHNTILHDFDCFPFFQNVIHNKLIEANQHLKKIEAYKHYPDLFHVYTLNEIIDVHEEQNEFINIVYKQCHAWREQTHHNTIRDKIEALERMTKKLETTVYHILYVAEQIRKRQETPVEQEQTEAMCIEQ